jgi:uncharacterized protein YqhQ
LKEQNRNLCAIKTSIGGQALMEGIMMRGPKRAAMAVRNTEGEIVLEEVKINASKRPAFCRWPVIRGVFGFFDSMSLGYKCLMRSAEISGLEDLVEEDPKKEKKNKKAAPAEEASVDACAEATEEKTEEKAEEEKKLPAWTMTAMMVTAVVIAVALAIFLFIMAPTALYSWIASFGVLTTDSAALNSLIKSAFEGVFKIVILVSYMALISLMKDIRRTFMYHGAEHKTIFCYEAGLELTVENVRKQRRFHPRCGTSFLILMLLVSIFVSFFIDPISIALAGKVLPMLWRTLVRFLLLPIVMGLGYELIKLAGKHDNFFTRLISMPGVWLQHITVFEPTDDMIECAIEAVKRVIPEDGSDRI